MKGLTAPIVAAALLAAVAGVATARTPVFQPQALEATGTVDSVNIVDGKLIVDDRTYVVSSTTPVTLPSGQRTRFEALTPGTRIGFTTSPTRGAGGKPQITQIWVLPKDYKSPAND
jgi:hypothetical protein